MKKTLTILLCAILLSLSLYGCEEKDVGPSQEEFFAITQMIQDGEYEQAEAALEEAYGQTEYAMRPSGDNKMNQYRLFYVSQGQYDEAMTVLLDYLQANDFVNYLADVPGDTLPTEDGCVYAVVQAKGLLESVSSEMKAEATELIGQDLLDKYE